jgi:hypothetical protein
MGSLSRIVDHHLPVTLGKTMRSSFVEGNIFGRLYELKHITGISPRSIAQAKRSAKSGMMSAASRKRQNPQTFSFEF